MGGGALFFSICPENALLLDSNEELMNCYEVVKEKPRELLGELDNLSTLEFSSKTFYEIRGLALPRNRKVERAARMIYLNRTAYNGLYRVNRSGKFNTPFGSYRSLSLPSSELIIHASAVLKNTILLTGDFAQILEKRVSKRDFVYLDPPYPPVSRYSDFNRYTKEFFGETDHRRLFECVKRLDEAGCKFVLSNADHPLIRELYGNDKFKILSVHAPRYINSRGKCRGNVSELLVTNCADT